MPRVQTVLENHHCALGFKLTASDTRVNILARLEPEVYKVTRVRQRRHVS